MTIHGRRRQTLAGACVHASVVAIGAVGCSLGGADLSQLEPGQCITGDVHKELGAKPPPELTALIERLRGSEEL